MERILQITSKKIDIRIKCNLATFPLKCLVFIVLIVLSLIGNDTMGFNWPLVLLVIFCCFTVFTLFSGCTIGFKKPFKKSKSNTSTQGQTQKVIKPAEPPKPTAKDKVAEAKPAANATKTNTPSEDVKVEKPAETPSAPITQSSKVTLLDELNDEDWEALFNCKE